MDSWAWSTCIFFNVVKISESTASLLLGAAPFVDAMLIFQDTALDLDRLNTGKASPRERESELVVNQRDGSGSDNSKPE